MQCCPEQKGSRRATSQAKATLVICYLLSGFQCHNDEDGATVHPSHAATVTHEVVQDCCELGTNLDETKRMSRRDSGRSKALLFPDCPLDSCAAIRLAWNRPQHKASLQEMKNSCSTGIKRVFKSSTLTKRKTGFLVMRMGKAQDPDSFD